MKTWLIAIASVVTLTATPALADRGDRGNSYRGDHYRGDRYRGDHYRGDRYRGHAYRSGYGGYYGRDHYRPVYRGGYGYRGYYGRPYRSRVVVVPAYGYGYGSGYDGYYGGYDRPVAYYDNGYRGGRGYYRCRTSGRGTVLGAIAGGLIGNAASSRYDRGAGTVIGAGIGAVAGTAIERDGRC